MAFQDAWSIDLARLRRCYVHVLAGGDRLVPFCAFNLTGADGRVLPHGRGAMSPETAEARLASVPPTR